MRLILAALMLAAAVFLTAADASAQVVGHCYTEPMVALSGSMHSQALSAAEKTPAKDLSWMASRIERVRPRAFRVAPGQSRAPVMCADPRQPGCHIDVPDVPEHGAWHSLVWDAARAMDGFLGLPPAPEGVTNFGGVYTGSARDGVARDGWRPPAA